jgi:hypothetical protein
MSLYRVAYQLYMESARRDTRGAKTYIIGRDARMTVTWKDICLIAMSQELSSKPRLSTS